MVSTATLTVCVKHLSSVTGLAYQLAAAADKVLATVMSRPALKQMSGYRNSTNKPAISEPPQADELNRYQALDYIRYDISLVMSSAMSLPLSSARTGAMNFPSGPMR